MKGARLDLTPLRRSRDLRLLFVGGGVSFFGSMLTFVAVPYQAYQLTHSSLVVGLLSLVEMAALLGTGLVGGLLADVADRRLVLRLTEVGMAASSGALLANALLGHPQVWVLFVVSFLLAGLDGLQRPSLDAMVPRLVPSDLIPASSALMSARTQVGMIAAPALSGLILAAGGLASAYAIDVGTFVVSLVALLMLGAMPPPLDAPETSLASIVEGLRYAVSRRDLLGSYLVDINATFFGYPNALFPQIASHLGGPSALGLLYAAPALGSGLVTATSGWTAAVRRQGRMIAVGAAVWGLGIIALGFADALWIAIVCLAVAGAGDMVSGLGRTNMWNQSIPDALRGRLAGVELLSYTTGPTLGNVESGLVESFAGLRTSIVSGGVACVAGTVALAMALPAFWHYHSREGEARRAAGPAAPPAAGGAAAAGAAAGAAGAAGGAPAAGAPGAAGGAPAAGAPPAPA